MKSRKIKLLFLLIILLIIPQLTYAGFLDSLACIENGQCGLDEIANSIVLLIRLMLGSMGAAALLYMVWGGFQWLVSGGNADRVKKGKDIIINTTFALFIAFGSYLIVTFFVNKVLNVKDENQIGSACQGVSSGNSCGSGYVCTGDAYLGHEDLCVSKCYLTGLQQTGAPYQCVSLTSVGIPAEKSVEEFVADRAAYYMIEGCADNQLCKKQ